VLRQLSSGPKLVHELNDVLDVEQSLLSHHLQELRENGLVQSSLPIAPMKVALVSRPLGGVAPPDRAGEPAFGAKTGSARFVAAPRSGSTKRFWRDVSRTKADSSKPPSLSISVGHASALPPFWKKMLFSIVSAPLVAGATREAPSTSSVPSAKYATYE
jgi:hypothetical protein